MLGTSEYLAWLRIVVALKTADTRACESGAQKRILSRAFGDSSPTRIAHDVDHRREGPTQTGRVRFFRRDAAGTLGQRRIPGSSLSEWYRKDRAVSVNRVEPKQQRDLQTRLFHRDALKLIWLPTITNIQRRTEQTLAREFEMLGAEFAVCFAVELLQLAQLLADRHLGQQRVNATFAVVSSLR